MDMRVLLATDGSDDARNATTWLHQLPMPPATEIRVLTVAQLPQAALDIPPVREFNQTLLDAARRTAEVASATLIAKGPVTVRVVDGEPREVIVREAREWPAELTVVGARGLGAVGRFLLGSVSTDVLHGAPGAVAVVRGAVSGPRHVLVGCDGSPDALEAIRFLGTLPLSRETVVRLLGVVTPPVIPPGPEMAAIPWPPTMDAYIEEQKAALGDVLTRAETMLGSRIRRVERSIVLGQPAAAIVAAAEERGTDLVVVGARGMGLLGRLVLGSVSDRVVHHAPCPVLVVKAKA
jgi:nucleotide-binding universal stress UspA family protein